MGKTKLSSTVFEEFLCDIPQVVSLEVYKIIEETSKVPRFPSVFKRVKGELHVLGFDYKNDLSEEQKSDLEYMVRDVFEGLREAGF